MGEKNGEEFGNGRRDHFADVGKMADRVSFDLGAAVPVIASEAWQSRGRRTAAGRFMPTPRLRGPWIASFLAMTDCARPHQAPFSSILDRRKA